MFTVVDQLPWLGKRELNCLLLFTYNYVVSVWRDLFFLRVLGIGYIILLWHSLSLPYIIILSFEWCTKLYSIILTYQVVDFQKGSLLYTVYIFIRIEMNFFTKVRKVRCTF